MKADRPDWNAPLNDCAGELNSLIEDYERDMVARKCIQEAKAGDLSWVRYGKDKHWRIFWKGERPLGEAPLLDRAGYGVADLEAISDAADAEMEKLMARLRSPAQEDEQP